MRRAHVDDGGAGASTASSGQADDSAIECRVPNVEGAAHASTVEEFVGEADLVVQGDIGAIEERPDTDVGDAVTTRLVASVQITEVLSGDPRSGPIDVFVATVTVRPESDAPPITQGPEGHVFKEGDEVILSLTAADDASERELITPYSYFVVDDGMLDAELAAWRENCGQTEVHLIFSQAEGVGLAGLRDSLRREARP